MLNLNYSKAAVVIFYKALIVYNVLSEVQAALTKYNSDRASHPSLLTGNINYIFVKATRIVSVGLF